MNKFTVGYFVGSLAKASLNRLLSKALIRLAPPGLQMVEIPFKDLPLYSPDYEVDYPAVAQALKDARPSTQPWLETARNYALYANEGGSYDDLLAYLKTRRLA